MIDKKEYFRKYNREYRKRNPEKCRLWIISCQSAKRQKDTHIQSMTSSHYASLAMLQNLTKLRGETNETQRR